MQQTDKSGLSDVTDAPKLVSGSEVINIPQIDLLPPGNPGRTAWFASDAGLSGVTKFKLLVDPSTANSLLLDVQNNGFPPPFPDAATDDLIVFPPELVPGAGATIDVPPFTRVGLFHDVYDETGVFNSGPNGILNDNPAEGTDDAYLSSEPEKSFSDYANYLMVKYYVVDPANTYQFTNYLGVLTPLGSGYRAFIFVDDDHSPNFDFDDMIVGILPRDCTAAQECDDGNFCNGAEACVENLCAYGTPPVCGDGNPCNGVETCSNNACQPAPLVYGLMEWKLLSDCLFGPDGPGGLAKGCECSDLNGDFKVDQLDVSEFQVLFETP